MPASDIVCDCGRFEAGIEFLELHEKEPFIIHVSLDFFKPVHIFRRDVVPASVPFTPLARVVRFPPRVSQSDESSSVLKYMHTDQTVVMTISETIFLLIVVFLRHSPSLHDGVLALLFEECSEDRVRGRTQALRSEACSEGRGLGRTYKVKVFLVRSSSEGFEAIFGVATF